MMREGGQDGRVRTSEVKRPIESSDFAPHRCECGNLLAKIVARGIELKCRRCKRVVVIAFGDIEGWQQRTPSPV
jgi:hypothetical protein